MLPTLPVTLADDVVRLEPLSTRHVGALHEAASLDRANYGLTLVPASLEAMSAYVDKLLAEETRGTTRPFATCNARTGRVVGSTRFMTIERWTWADAGNPRAARARVRGRARDRAPPGSRTTRSGRRSTRTQSS